MESTLNGSWKALWKECVHDFRGFANPRDEVSAIIMLAQHKPGERFKDIQEDNITKLLEYRWENLFAEDLMKVMARGGRKMSHSRNQ